MHHGHFFLNHYQQDFLKLDWKSVVEGQELKQNEYVLGVLSSGYFIDWCKMYLRVIEF